jgi:hypothetical protein
VRDAIDFCVVAYGSGPLRLTIAMLMLDIGTKWILNALLTTSNS